ncbi:MAG TPA: VCBS repeat-containing protein, partial [Rudaea sp.]
IVVFLNQTTGPGLPNFAAPVPFNVGAMTTALAVIDLNGDGRPDIVTANSGANSLSFVLNTTAPGSTTPSFADAVSYPLAFAPITLAAADFNDDGKPDLAVAGSANPGLVQVLVNATPAGAGTPQFPLVAQASLANGAGPLIPLDYNGDGKRDILIVQKTINAAVMLTNTTASAPQFAVDAGHTFGTGLNPAQVAVGDLNGDGKSDVVAVNQTDNSVSVFVNTTPPDATTPTFATPVTLATAANPESVLLADVNDDGRLDVVAGAYDASQLSVFINTTAPGASVATFAARQNFNTGLTPSSVAAADINGDGLLDVISTSPNFNGVSVVLNTGTAGAASASFGGQHTFGTGQFPLSVAVGDLNGDGKPDIVSTNTLSANVSVLLNTTPIGATLPSFAAQQTFGVGTSPYSVAIADVDGDGKPDLIVANFGTSTVSVLVNTTAPGAATPSFAAQRTFPTGSEPGSVQVADVDGDGLPDLIIADLASANLCVLRNTTLPAAAHPSFGTCTLIPAGAGVRYVALADIDGDGMPDLIAANYADANVEVWLNTTYRAQIGAAAATGTISHDKIFANGFEHSSTP